MYDRQRKYISSLYSTNSAQPAGPASVILSRVLFRTGHLILLGNEFDGPNSALFHSPKNG